MIADEELHPPSPRRVALRAVVLACVNARANLELEEPDPVVMRADERTREIVERTDVRDELEPHERALISAPHGELDEQMAIDGTWRAEALAVLAWALGRFDPPSFDADVDPLAVVTTLGMAEGDVDESLLAEPSLRPSTEIDSLSELLFAAHWRLRQFGLDGASIDFETVASTVWFGPLLISGLPLAGRDLAVRGRPISDADPEVLDHVESILRERRAAAGWLRGEEELLSEVPLDT